ncbi:hypothetical protein F4677DRAFT_441686 [Hypoxylon crocopeplum]|nr:hypothetical protein F4677DRAFT_441686 [Hypoxylon crocopeplum]
MLSHGPVSVLTSRRGFALTRSSLSLAWPPSPVLSATGNGSGDGDGDSGACRLTDNYSTAYTDFFGCSMPCIFKQGTVWEVCNGPDAQPFEREARPIYDPENAENWLSVGQALWKYIETLGIEWTFIDPLAYTNAGEVTPFCSFVVVIGMRPFTVPFGRAVEVAAFAEKMLHDAGFAGAEVAVAEGERKRAVGGGRGPQLLSFDPLLNDVPELRKLFTSTLGLPIAPLKFPHFAGTGSLFYRFDGDDKRVALLTCAHVAHPPSEYPNNGTTITDNNQPREKIISPGLGDPKPNEDRRTSKRRTEHLSLVDGAKERIEQVKALFDEVQDRADPGKRVIGFVLHCEPIEASLEDWAVIELYDRMLNWDTFRGNQAYVAARTTATQYSEIMWPHAADSADYQYPTDGLLQAFGVVQEEELRNPQHLDVHSQKCLLVVKNGTTTSTTFGRVNGLESFIRYYPTYGINETSTEIAVLRYSKEHPRFSEFGDSGSIVLDRAGQVVGGITGDGGASDGTDISYITPYYDIHAQLTSKYPGIHLYPTESAMSDDNKEDGKGEQQKRPTTKEKLLEEITTRIEESKKLQEESIQLHKQAEEADDPAVAEDLKFQARELDKKAAKLLKTAKRLESGWMQGGAAGAGIGAGIAGGLGMTVGSLVSGLVAIPTTGLGILVGAGTGLVHGPWVKFTQAFSKDEVDEIDREAEEEARRIGEA